MSKFTEGYMAAVQNVATEGDLQMVEFLLHQIGAPPKELIKIQKANGYNSDILLPMLEKLAKGERKLRPEEV